VGGGKNLLGKKWAKDITGHRERYLMALQYGKKIENTLLLFILAKPIKL
jgi:hypothetical protein